MREERDEKKKKKKKDRKKKEIQKKLTQKKKIKTLFKKHSTLSLSPSPPLSRCFNGAPNTAFISSSSDNPSLLDAAGFIRVDEHLRVVGKEDQGWFALGDASSAPGVKLGYLARAQASTVASNIKAVMKAAKEKSTAPNLSKWSANNGLEMMLVTLGKGSGTGHLGKWVRFPGVAVAAIKGRDLFVGKTRAGLGVA